MIRFLDWQLGGLRFWRRLRGGRWHDVMFVPAGIVVGWVRREPSMGEWVAAAEDYTLPRARALP